MVLFSDFGFISHFRYSKTFSSCVKCLCLKKMLYSNYGLFFPSGQKPLQIFVNITKTPPQKGICQFYCRPIKCINKILKQSKIPKDQRYTLHLNQSGGNDTYLCTAYLLNTLKSPQDMYIARKRSGKPNPFTAAATQRLYPGAV